MEKLIQILKEIRPDVDFENEKHLADEGILDSFDIISIVSEFSEVFKVKITANMLKPENFNSAAAMWDLVQKLNGGKSTS